MAKAPAQPKKPTLFRTSSPEYVAWAEARRRTEEPWRHALKSIPQAKLIEMAVSGAWTAKLLRQEVDRLSAEVEKHRASRSAAAAKSRPAQKLARVQIHRDWLDEVVNRPSRFIARRFAHKMVSKYSHAITDVLTVERWCRKWAAEMRGAEGFAAPATMAVAPPPEVYVLLGYLDPDGQKEK